MSEGSNIQRSFWTGKLFSLTGIIPIGIYLVVHLYHNLISLQGADAFNRHLAESRSFPFIVPITILAIWIPILFHGLYGLRVMKISRPNLGRFRYFENLKYVLQRLSGIGLLLFIPAHIYKTRLEPHFEHQPLDFLHMSEGLREPLTLIVYALGILGVAYHAANGLWQFSIGWGLTTSQRGMNRMFAVSVVLGIVLLAMGYGAVYGFIR